MNNCFCTLRCPFAPADPAENQSQNVCSQDKDIVVDQRCLSALQIRHDATRLHGFQQFSRKRLSGRFFSLSTVLQTAKAASFFSAPSARAGWQLFWHLHNQTNQHLACFCMWAFELSLREVWYIMLLDAAYWSGALFGLRFGVWKHACFAGLAV